MTASQHQRRAPRSTFVLAACVVPFATAASAQQYEYAPVGYVTAESDYGNGTVSGPVRETARGLQVRTPGGNWIYCEKSCKDTLRLATIDFFHSEQGAGQDGFTSQGPGVFGKWKWEWGW